MEQQFRLRPIVQDLKLKKFLEFFTKQTQTSITRIESLKPGDEISFQLQAEKEAVLSYVGQVPEKIAVEGNTNKLRVVMPDRDCILIFWTEEDAWEAEVAYSIR